MLYRVVGAAALALIVVSAQSKAAGDDLSQRIDQIHNDCGEEAGFPHAIAECIVDKDKEYGLELERLYQRVLKEMPRSNVAVLRKSQRAWLEYQKQTCKSYELAGLTHEEHPGLARVGSALCLLRTTLQRVEELRALLP